MAVGQFCRWDWLVFFSSQVDGISYEDVACPQIPAHVVVVRRVPAGGGLTLQADAEVCAHHERVAQAVDGYQRSIKLRAHTTT